jgi:hypothetical protein
MPCSLSSRHTLIALPLNIGKLLPRSFLASFPAISRTIAVYIVTHASMKLRTVMVLLMEGAPAGVDLFSARIADADGNDLRLTESEIQHGSKVRGFSTIRVRPL